MINISNDLLNTENPNTLIFDNTYNPPASYQWGIRNVRVIEPLVSPPLIAPMTTPTNQSILTLSGTKLPGTSIWINGIEKVALDSQTSWSCNVTLTEGPNNISVTAKDASLNESDPVVINIVLDTQLPTVSLTNIVDGQYLNSIINVIAEASDNLGVAKVVFYLDTDLKVTDDTYPFVWLWNVGSYANALYHLKAVTYDLAGNTAEAGVNVTVDTTPPSISITYPPDGEVYFGD
jgi:hypothetical protein